MRHNKVSKRLSRRSGHLRALLANLTNDLLSNERIRTTTPKAKMLRRYAERMITLGKKNTLASRRRAMAFLRNKANVTKLFEDLAKRFADRNGGYTRVLRVGFRPGDSAPMSIIELVGKEAEEAQAVKPAVKKAKKAAPKKKAAAKTAEPKEKKAAKPKAEKEGAEKKATKKASSKTGTKKAAGTKAKPAAKPAAKKTTAAKKTKKTGE